MDFTVIEQQIVQAVSAKRLRHCTATALVARSLAERFPNRAVDTDEAYLVGLWHDIAREWTDDALYAFCIDHTIEMEQEEAACPMLLHGAVAGRLLMSMLPGVRQTLQVAIRWHTLGSVFMGALGAVLFIADYIEPNRRYIDDQKREYILGKPTLEAMCLAVIEMTEEYFLHCHQRKLAHTTARLQTYLQQGFEL
ncbi:MAG: hypothetical protein GXY60_02455 [Spirochaetales bacterium]|nr:hypothetical protein [Spirochaetales bacterium]